MKNNFKRVTRNFSKATNKLVAKVVCTLSDCKRTLSNENGSLTVEQMLWIIVGIVVIVVLVLPQLWNLLKGALDNADSKVDDIWNYKG